MSRLARFLERFGVSSSRPNDASVTRKKCSCGYLEGGAVDPDSPIIFDDTTGEYQFTFSEPDCDGTSMLVLYHCPFCGGAAQKSKRDQLFVAIPRKEAERLASILTPIRTMEEPINMLGTPSLDDFSISRTFERDGAPPTMQHYRTVRYNYLSDIADVCITEGPDGKVFWQLQGKPRAR